MPALLVRRVGGRLSRNTQPRPQPNRNAQPKMRFQLFQKPHALTPARFQLFQTNRALQNRPLPLHAQPLITVGESTRRTWILTWPTTDREPWLPADFEGLRRKTGSLLTQSYRRTVSVVAHSMT